LKALGAQAGYTLDGQGADAIDVETFSADLASVTIRGVNIHPGIAKGRMVNALRVAADLLARLPCDAASPETTADRQGFLHPYEIQGGVAEVKLQTLLRDFETPALGRWAAVLKEAAAGSAATWTSAPNTATWPRGSRESRVRWPLPNRPWSVWGARRG